MPTSPQFRGQTQAGGNHLHPRTTATTTTVDGPRRRRAQKRPAEELLLALLLLLLALVLPSCGGWPWDPDPTPTPTPIPSPTPDPSMLLRRDGPVLTDLAGTPVPFLGAIPCCEATEASTARAARPLPLLSGSQELLTGWPIPISPEWRAWVHERVGERPVFFHARLGPFFGDATAEPEWVPTGGPYTRRPDGLADLSSFNSAFWDRVRAWGHEACLEGDYIEYGLIDRWWAKQTSIPNPMRAEWNVQSYDMNLHVGRVTIQPGSYEDLWLQQVVRVLGPLPCVIWEDGNEVGLGPYSSDWTFSMRERVRFHEEAVGQGVVHLFATNSGKADTEAGPVDYIERHQNRPVPSPIHGKPSLVNEYNPHPPLTADESFARFCEARSNGTYWWAWRHTMPQSEYERILQLMAEGDCQTPPPPPPVAECPLTTPTARQAAALGMNPTIKVQSEGRAVSATPFFCPGPDYYCQPGMDWPAACQERKSCGPIAPPGHPSRLACEQHFLEAPCPRFTMDRCTGTGDQCPVTFDPFICIREPDDPPGECTNQNHPRNVAAGCSETYVKDPSGHVLSGEWWWATAHGKGYVRATNKDGSVAGVSPFEVDQ